MKKLQIRQSHFEMQLESRSFLITFNTGNQGDIILTLLLQIYVKGKMGVNFKLQLAWKVSVLRRAKHVVRSLHAKMGTA